MSKNKTLCIAEWQVFGVDDIYQVLKSCHTERSEVSKNPNKDRDISLSTKAQYDKKAQNIFKELKNFADDKGNHIFLNSYGKNRLKARNYVGLIQTKSGFCLEILPKTFRTANENEGFEIRNCTCSSPIGSSCNDDTSNIKCQVCKAKNLLLKMLKTLKNSPFKQSHISNLKTQNAHLLEIFVIMFLNELETLIKKGLKSDYIECEQNRKFLKGKLLFTQNLKHNFAHKERFFTASDEFSSDIAPNKLIKSTLLLLSTRHFSTKTNARIMQSRFVFDEISPSQNYDKDFAKCVNLRHFKAYELILLWCKIFLKKQTFTAYQGSEKAFALLFDMNELFESFVAWHLKRYVAHEQCKYKVKTQDTGKHLLLENDKENKFRIRPDIVGYKNNKANFIADTKWKILNFSRNDYGVSQSDLYQVFAYLSKYQCQNGILIYPKIDDENNDLQKLSKQTFTYKAVSNLKDDDNKKPSHTLQIYFFDLDKTQNSQIYPFEDLNSKIFA